MTQTLTFTRWEGNHPRLQCVWNDELRFFPDEDHARAWASRQGLRAVFECCPHTFEACHRGDGCEFKAWLKETK